MRVEWGLRLLQKQDCSDVPSGYPGWDVFRRGGWAGQCVNTQEMGGGMGREGGYNWKDCQLLSKSYRKEGSSGQEINNFVSGGNPASWGC